MFFYSLGKHDIVIIPDFVFSKFHHDLAPNLVKIINLIETILIHRTVNFEKMHFYRQLSFSTKEGYISPFKNLSVFKISIFSRKSDFIDIEIHMPIPLLVHNKNFRIIRKSIFHPVTSRSAYQSLCLLSQQLLILYGLLDTLDAPVRYKSLNGWTI